MGKRGPTANNLTVLEVAPLRRPEPLKGMSAASKKVWVEFVGSFAPDYFKPCDHPLIKAYCDAYVLHSRAVKEVNKRGCPEFNRWFKVMKESNAMMNSTATKLRACPNARISGWKADTSTKPQPQKEGRKGLMFGS